MKAPVFGLETEYAFAALNVNGRRLDPDVHLARLIELATDRWPHLRDCGSGLFFANGGRLYIDSGLHPEFSTPECSNPWDVVRYTLAGESLLARLVAELETGPEVGELRLWRCNVDYGGSRTTWGCHESYLHRASSMSPMIVRRAIVPHLVSRIIYTGAGGFNNIDPGLQFLLSPRAPHLSLNSRDGRALISCKEESLSGAGYHRLHIVTGESLCSHRAAFLKLGVTALVVRLIEAGRLDLAPVQLLDPTDAMRRFAADPTCRARAPLADGAAISALEIQRYLLERVESEIGSRNVPDWTQEVCREWRTMLDLLEEAPDSIVTTLDWGIKLALFQRRTERRGFDWQRRDEWSRMLAQHAEASPIDSLSDLRRDLLGVDLPWSLPIFPSSGRAHGSRTPKPEGYDAVLALRNELCEIDSRFGQLHTQGIFAALDRAGLVNHRLPRIHAIEDAVQHPPDHGRAKTRGDAIRRLQDRRGELRCDWKAIYDCFDRVVVDLHDPYGGAHWKKIRDDQEPSAASGDEATDCIPF